MSWSYGFIFYYFPLWFNLPILILLSWRIAKALCALHRRDGCCVFMYYFSFLLNTIKACIQWGLKDINYVYFLQLKMQQRESILHQNNKISSNVLGLNGKENSIRKVCLVHNLQIINVFIFPFCYTLGSRPKRPIKEPGEEKHQISSDSLEGTVLQC